MVEQLFGPFRDYNGGLLSQQNKQLEQIKKDLRDEYETFSPQMQELFTFHPPSFQTLISTSMAKHLFIFFISFLRKEKTDNPIVIDERKKENTVFIFLKTASFYYHKKFFREIQDLQKESQYSLGYSSFEFEEEYYLCLIDLNNELNLNFKEHFEKIIQGKTKNKNLFEKQKILKINFQEGDPPSLNPQIAIDQRCRCLGKALFEGLTRFDAKGTPKLAGASDVTISSCQTVYTFTLRKQYWSNGEEVTAFDFEQAWKNGITHDSHCLRSDLFFIIKNAKEAHFGLKPLNEVKITAINNKTLVVELEYPAFYFLHLLSHPIFSPIYKGEQEPYHFNGPFLLKEWQRGHHLTLTSNPYYWDKKNVHLQGVVVSMHKEIDLIRKLFEQGELDWIGEPFNASSSEALPVKEAASWCKKKVDQFYWIYVNTRVYPLSSVNIRKALAYAINRTELAKTLSGKPHYIHPFPSRPIGAKKWDGNGERARAFFNEGLKDLKISSERFPKITLNWSFEVEEQGIRMIQKQIETTLGIEIKVQQVPWNHLCHRLDKREFEISTCYRSSPYFYPRSYLELFRESSNLYNASQWENANYKDLIDKALQSSHIQEREKFLIQAEEILLDELPIIPLLLADFRFLLSPTIKKIAIVSNGDVDFTRVIKTST